MGARAVRDHLRTVTAMSQTGAVSTRRFLMPVTALILAVAMGGCAENSVLEPGLESPFPPLPADQVDGVRGSLLVGPWLAGVQEVAVWMEADDNRLGAYQARLRFDFSVLNYEGSESSDEGFRVLNAEKVQEGELRFAGFAAEGFDDPEVIRIRFESDRQVEPGELTLLIEAIGTLEGEAVPEAKMLALPGLHALPMKLD